ncbi:MAG: hypothetical protein WKF47_15460 [Geodermatophilaceae bacterium]
MALKRTDATAGATSAGRATARREFTAAVLLTAAIGALGLLAGSRTWLNLRVDREPRCRRSRTR